jgi:hypothetical protein
MIDQERSPVPVHPILLALYPALALLSNNIGQIRPSLGLRALAISVLLGVVLFVLMRILVGNWSTAALLASLAIFLFYSYGPTYDLLSQVTVAGERLGRHRYLAPVWLVLLIGGAAMIARRQGRKKDLTVLMNLVAAVAVAVPLVSVVGDALGIGGRSALTVSRPELVAQLDPALERPDVYYIVLDAYGREDVLRREFDLDNIAFLEALEGLGFQIAGCSQSNYAQTELTFASALNLAYLQDLGLEMQADSEERSAMWPMIRNSLVRQLLEEMDYSVVAFETGFRWSELEDADVYLKPPTGLPIGLNAFEATLLRSTAAWILADQAAVLPEFIVRDFDRSAEQHYQRVRFVLDELERMAETSGPKFVFAHIVAPHPPFVLGPEGEFRDSPQAAEALDPAIYVEGYRDQVVYLNRRIEQVLSRIVNESDPSPVILLQADHGPGHGSAADRMSILNALRIPEQPGIPMSDDQTPINTFRFMLDQVFGMDLSPLPDTSYFSIYQTPYDFSIVANTCEHQS